MNETTQKKLNELYSALRRIRTYHHALALLEFDFETSAPEMARDKEGEVISFFSNQAFRISNSKKTKDLIVYLNDKKEELSELDRALVDGLYENYLKDKNVSAGKQLKWSKMLNSAYIDWVNAKNAQDFSIFKRSLSNVIKIHRESVALRDNKLENVYDNVLNDCEKGVLSGDLDVFFEELKVGLKDLIGKIKASKHNIRTDFLSRPVPIYKQEEFSRYLLELNGYDFGRGYLTTTEHPFTIDIAENDARVTTHYYENNFLSNIYSVVHEGGHAIFMQNERKVDYEHFINDRITNGMHESVSRFYENVIGRSEEYIHLIYPKFHELFAEELGDVTERELYEAVNLVTPSLIRTDADEVTYGLHIVIRYELEKALFDGSIKVKDLPRRWNALYKEYLGVCPKNDSEGVLQDTHWSGSFGYFPSYALGNAYNAMYLKEIKKAMDFSGAIENGAFEAIKSWLKDNVFAKANVLPPKKWLEDITGKSLSAKDFLEYLNEKYSKIYEF